MLTGVAALALVLVQVFAIIVHARRGEQKMVPTNAALLLLAAAVAALYFFNWANPSVTDTQVSAARAGVSVRDG